MNRLTVKTPDKKEYDIVLDGRRSLIVSDTNVAPLYLEKLETVLNGKNIVTDCIVLPAGEESKSQDNAMMILTKLIEHNFKSSDIVIALGGGVIGDNSGKADQLTAFRVIGTIAQRMPDGLLHRFNRTVFCPIGFVQQFRQLRNRNFC